MEYRQFPAVPATLMLQIIRKCYPIPYIRLRQSCRFMDEFCEQIRKHLGIYGYRKDPHLLVTSSLHRSHFFNFYALWPKRAWEDVAELDENEYYLVLDYDKCTNYLKFIIPLNIENIDRIRRALSGFGFIQVFVEYLGETPATKELTRNLDNALTVFLEIVAELKVKQLSMFEVPLALFTRLTNTWKLEKIVMFSYDDDIHDHLQLNSVKNIASISYETWFSDYRFDEKAIVDVSRGKKYVRICDGDITPAKAWTAVKWIYEDWTRVKDVPDSVELGLRAHFLYNRVDIIEEESLHLPSKDSYLGCLYIDQDCLQDIWLIETPRQRLWRMVILRRGMLKRSKLLVQTSRSREQLAMLFIECVKNCGRRTFGIDFSPFYEGLIQAETVEEVRKQFSSFLDLADIEQV